MVQVAEGQITRDVESGAQSKPDLLKYGSTTADKSDIPLEEQVEEAKGGGMKNL
jgi:hypothetical protein